MINVGNVQKQKVKKNFEQFCVRLINAQKKDNKRWKSQENQCRMVEEDQRRLMNEITGKKQ